MKRIIRKMAAISVGCWFVMAGTVLGEEIDETETELASAAMDNETENAESETETEAVILEELQIQAGEKALKIANATSQKISELYVKKTSEEEWEEENLLEGSTVFQTEDGVFYDLKAVENSSELVYCSLKLAGIEELQLFEVAGATWVRYYDTDSGQETDTREYPIEMNQSPEIFYTTSMLNVRELPNPESKILETLALGQEINIYGKTGNWYLVKSQERYGYISGSYVTENKEEADQMVEAEAAARAALEAQAAAQARAAAQAQQKPSSGKKSSKPSVYEVSRENIPGCDDPNHGTTYITYSDGSVKTVNY